MRGERRSLKKRNDRITWLAKYGIAVKELSERFRKSPDAIQRVLQRRKVRAPRLTYYSDW